MTRRTLTQLIVFVTVSVTAGAVMAFGYLDLPNLFFGVGHYQVKLELAETGGLYERGNVTYRGTEVGQVTDVTLTDTGVQATLSLKSGISIPSDLRAEVHSQSAIGEQYVALLPRNDTSAPLKNGDVIDTRDTSIPPDINTLLDSTNRGLAAIPGDDLKTTIDEGYTAVGGLGPDLARFVKGSTALAIDARKNLDDLTNVIDNVAPVLDTQSDTADSVQAWASHLATVTQQLQRRDADVVGVLRDGPAAADEARRLFERLQPTLPVLLANLASIAPIFITYKADLEQLLVLLPQGTASLASSLVPNVGTKQAYKGLYLDFNLNFNLPPPCTTGFLPAQQMRPASLEDYPDRPQGDLYCRIPQDAAFNVRGARNIPCETRPGKRAPTVKLCESDQDYVPLNDGMNWKGDPNATLSGQDVPQLPPGAAPPAAPPAVAPMPPIAAAEYDPATGQYVGPDGKTYAQTNLAPTAGPQTWQSMLVPPATP